MLYVACMSRIDRAHLATIWGGQQVHQVTDRGMAAYKSCVGKASDALGSAVTARPDADGVRQASNAYKTAVGNCIPELAK